MLTYMAIHLLHSFIAYKNMYTNKKKRSPVQKKKKKNWTASITYASTTVPCARVYYIKKGTQVTEYCFPDSRAVACVLLKYTHTRLTKEFTADYKQIKWENIFIVMLFTVICHLYTWNFSLRKQVSVSSHICLCCTQHGISPSQDCRMNIVRRNETLVTPFIWKMKYYATQTKQVLQKQAAFLNDHW